MYIYLILNIFTFIFPFLLSFDKKVAFYKKWKALIPAILIAATIFIVWDVWFTDQGVWEFNSAYLVGIYYLGLPLEEWLFFFTVPYACVFIYECIIAYFPNVPNIDKNNYFSWFLAIILGTLALLMKDRLYTFITFISLSAFITFHKSVLKTNFWSHFYWAYILHLIPFSIINGVLTALPIVIYNNEENLGIRLGTIPVEDTMYSMLLLLLTITYYERFLSKGLGVRTYSNKEILYE